MSDISIVDNNLIVSLDDVRANNRIVHNFLSSEHLVATPEGFVTSNVNYWKIIRIIRFFEQLSWPLNQDQNCTSIIENFQNEQANFQNGLDQALRIKESPLEPGAQITIPGFTDEVEFLPYQIMPIQHAYELGNAANFSVPGGGKTCMAYATYFLFRNDPEPQNVEKLLVICPLNAFTAWEEEYTRLTGDTQRRNVVRLHPSSVRSNIINNPSNNHNIFLINYDAVRNDDARNEIIDNLIGRGLDRTRFMIILDESHKIKNFSSQQSEGVRALSTHAHRRLILTGTPMPTRWVDLWNQFNFLFPDNRFIENYSTYEARIGIPQFQNEIRRRLEPTWTRVTKAQLDLPESLPIFIPIPMMRRQEQIYRTIATDLLLNQAQNPWTRALRDFNGFIWLIEVATDPALLRKRNDFTDQLISDVGVSIDDLIDDYMRYESPGKLDAIRPILEEDWFSRDHGKVIIWANFKSTMTKLRNMFDSMSLETRVINGDVSLPDREQYLRDFRFDVPDCNILIANPATLSESISLHMECHRAIYVDRTYNTAHWMQSKERIHRINMPENARYYVFLSEFSNGGQTIDHLIRDRLEENERRMNEFLNARTLDVHGLDVRYDEDDFLNNGASDNDLQSLFNHLRELTTL